MARAYFGIDKVSQKKRKLYEIIFEADTKEGKRFDVMLLWLILLSVVIVLLESVDTIREGNETLFLVLEWIITLLFTAEYAVRIYCLGKKMRYIFSFYGIIDLLAILPTFLGILFPIARSLMVIRAMRLLRVFRILQLDRLNEESRSMTKALRHSGAKILVFLFGVLTVVIVFGTVMYLIESPSAGFTNIPQSVYWAIVTLTTVGYGDIVPLTPLGRALAAVIMILGYGIIAVPTGIVSSEMARQQRPSSSPAQPNYKQFACPSCQSKKHMAEAKFCQNCGEPFN